MRRRQKPETILQLAGTSFELIQISSKVNELKKLNSLLQSILPKELKNNCTVANIHVRTGKLILATSSPIWKHKARFMSESILTILHNHEEFSFIKDIGIISLENINPMSGKDSDQMVSNRAVPSTEVIEQVQNTADFVEHEGLSKALSSLAKKWQSITPKS